MTDLDKERLRINEIDKKIAALFEERMEVVKNIALFKKKFGLQIFDSAREQEVCERELGYIQNAEIKPYFLEFVHNMMDVSKKYQSYIVQGCRVSYCGIEGAFANIAAKRIFPEGNLISYPSFPKAYNAVVEGECDFAVLPIENSFAGDVGQVFDLMHTGELFISELYEFKITQNLLGTKDSELSDIKKVVSHQQALDQSMEFLQSHKFEIESAANTAIAAKMVADNGDKTVAAVGSEESAALYGLKILERNINQNMQNTTRFAVFSRVFNPVYKPNDSIFLLMFTIKNKPGSLAEAIKCFGESGFNLRSLRSRPIKDVPWEYYFYVEGEGCLSSDAGKKLIEELQKVCVQVKVLGHFSMEKKNGRN